MYNFIEYFIEFYGEKNIIKGLTVFGVVLTTLTTYYYNQYRDASLKLSDKKYSTYSEVVKILFDMVKEKKGLLEYTHDELLSRIIDVKSDLILYGSNKIVKQFLKWEEN